VEGLWTHYSKGFEPLKQLHSQVKYKPGQNRNRLNSVDCADIYHIGIIDFLQVWTMGKVMENWWKTYIDGQVQQNLSSIEPFSYKKRF
jgi:hypothetical protein